MTSRFAGTAGGAKTGTVSGGPTIYTVSVTGMTTSGTVIATIGANVATDLVGNNNTGSTSTDNTVTWDVTAPTVTINQAVAQADPTNASPINFTVTFSEAVAGFATGDVSFTGSTVGGVLVGTVTGAGPTYNVAVTGMTGAGTVVASIGAAVATDLAGNANAASTSTDNTVTFDNVAPTVTISLQAASDTGISNSDNITNAASPVFNLTFSETVVGLLANDLSNVGTATGCVFGAPAGSGCRVDRDRHWLLAGHADRSPAGQRRHRPCRQRQCGHQRGDGHDRPDEPDRDHQPGGRAARPDQRQPDQLHGRVQRDGVRLRNG